MQRARRGHQSPTPGTTREWGVMLRSEERRYRYINTIGNRNYIYYLITIKIVIVFMILYL